MTATVAAPRRSVPVAVPLPPIDAFYEAEASRPINSSLPTAISSFVGRSAQLRELAALLTEHRVVCLVGSAGVGKTRLALEAVRAVDDGSICSYLALDAVRDGAGLMTAIASALEIHDHSEAYSDVVIAEALGSTPRRLVLDGAERLRKEVALVAERLLGAAPALRLVITSSRELGIAGQRTWNVAPLSCPSPDAPLHEIESADAVTLFLTRVRERVAGVVVDPRVVAELCSRLGGLPLAIELTAAWSGTLSVEQILRDHAVLLGEGQTLDGVLAASHKLLAPAEQRLFAALCVFCGGFTFEDARALADPDDTQFATHLRMLVDSSWLSVDDRDGDWRFTIADTVRDFGRARLRDSAVRDEVRRRHAVHFAEIAQGSEDGLAGAESKRWLARMRAADADLQEALRWSREAGDVTLGLTMTAALWRWWVIRGQLQTGRTWLRVLNDAAGSRSDLLAGRSLRAAAILAVEDSDPAEAMWFGRGALRILVGLGDLPQAALAASVLGSTLRYLGEHVEARQQFQSALQWRRELGDARGEAAALNDLALLALDTGRLEDARQLLEQSLSIKRRLGEPRAIARGLCNLSEVLIRTNHLDAAEIAIAEAFAIGDRLADRQLSGNLLCNRGDLAHRRGDWSLARQRYRAALRRYGDTGSPHDIVLALVGLGRVLIDLGRMGEGIMQLHRAEAIAERAGTARPLAYARSALADVTGSPKQALPAGVTVRQAEVLGYLAAGLSNKEIACILQLSVATVERHLATVYRNVGLRGRVDAARFATENGLLRPSN